ncbi:bacillithiol system redox-active protein YtxJ [Halobacillus shinanisalinarum]|uniref:Bacillithiol system redox-active protein YtxJ n=1 Tax=Halobacillus shinanisalinarum TaxID=2932258 RepID=A0ABY4H3I3_9BACI|nr:bacillithiol system redox-active protein YtxJ [Halobacillus shinanisalinarum]UOQ94157.1 bacillithiol system redox-active protein YtxJ [Halobacillus shinanisalinarum]
MEIKFIETKKQFDEVVENNEKFFLFKHSLTCPISASAKKEFEKYSGESLLPCYMIHVQEAREISNAIAQDFSVKHESPQVLLFNKEAVGWHESHQNITNASLSQAAEQ